MKTLTVTEARKNLSSWLRRAKAGEEIGIVDGADIIALRPVAVTAVDYMSVEYRLTEEEADAAGTRMVAEAADERSRGELIPLETVASRAPRRTHKAGSRVSRKPKA